MLILRLEDIRQVVDMNEAIEVIQEAFCIITKREMVIPNRIHIPATKGNTTLIMPAYLKSSKEIGVKIVSVFPTNLHQNLPVVLGCIIYLDGTTGKPLAIMDGTYLTALRTGAVGGIGCRWMSRENSHSVAIIGAGVQARMQFLAANTVRLIKKVYIYDLSAHAAQSFLKWMEQIYPDVKTVVCVSAEEAVQNADIVITATTSTKPVFDYRAIKPGTHINGIGSFTPQMQEIPEEVVIQAKVVVDFLDGALAEAGDLIIPLKKGLISREKIFGEIGEVVLGRKKGRESEEEITLFESVGVAVMDVAIASFVYRKARENSLGVEINIDM